VEGTPATASIDGLRTAIETLSSRADQPVALDEKAATLLVTLAQQVADSVQRPLTIDLDATFTGVARAITAEDVASELLALMRRDLRLGESRYIVQDIVAGR
jgi:hypothetical protein